MKTLLQELVEDVVSLRKERERRQQEPIDQILARMEQDIYRAISEIEEIVGDREKAVYMVTHHLDVM